MLVASTRKTSLIAVFLILNLLADLAQPTLSSELGPGICINRAPHCEVERFLFGAMQGKLHFGSLIATTSAFRGRVYIFFLILLLPCQDNIYYFQTAVSCGLAGTGRIVANPWIWFSSNPAVLPGSWRTLQKTNDLRVCFLESCRPSGSYLASRLESVRKWVTTTDTRYQMG